MLAAGAVAALPTAAHAGARFDYRQVFTTPVPGASTGVDTTILYKHPDDPNAKPIPVRQEVFTFPAGTQFDDSIVPDCTVPDIQLQLQGESACPQESWIGSGHGNTSMTGFPGAGENAITANAFDYGSGEFRVLGASADLPIRAVAHGRREGRITTVQIPSTPGGPPDGEGALRRVHNVFPARSLGRRAYVRTPKTCPRSGTWLFKASLTFADGAVDNASYRMPCRRR
jgi:hypothetical protein